MKIKEEQLNKIKKQQESLNSTIHDIGVLESQKHALLHDLAGINQDVESLKKELEEEYGAVNINLEDGSYTEIEKEEVENV
tara:strand:+ start:720 stop:962 length:243 start_codon:yes stop_codon:yes gene_type:complete